MSDAYHKRLAQIKAVYPRAYERWTEKEESGLNNKTANNQSMTVTSIKENIMVNHSGTFCFILYKWGKNYGK